MTKARLFLTPLDGAISETEITEPTKIIDIFPDVEVMEWFEDGGSVLLNGHLIPPDLWNVVKIKPNKHSSVDFIHVPRGKKTFLLLATVALVALTTAVSGGLLGPAGVGIGLGILGSSFAAGGIGATLLASAIGLAGSLALSALSAPPKGDTSGGNQKALSTAGVTGNTVSVLDTLPVIFGKIGYSPPHLAPPYTIWNGDELIANAVVGVEGRCLIENIKINGLPIDTISGLTYEVREGKAGDAARTTFLKTVIEERDGISISNFNTKLESSKTDYLDDQTTPSNSEPQWHTFRTSGVFDEAVFRLMFPSGIVYTPGGHTAALAIHVEMRKVGDVSWRKLPTFHIADYKLGAGQMRAEIRLKRQRLPSGRHFCTAWDNYPIFEASNINGYGQSFEYVSDAYFGSATLSAARYSAQELPTFTAATQSGYTASGSSTFAVGTEPWRVFDASVDNAANYWRPAKNTLGSAYVQLQCPAPTKFKSYGLHNVPGAGTATPTTLPTQWKVEGSNDGTNWTNLDDAGLIDITDDVAAGNCYGGVFQIGNPDFYTYYRWTFLANNGAANQEIRVGAIRPRTINSIGTILNEPDEGSGPWVNGIAFHNSALIVRCIGVHLSKTGADVYLDPDDWDSGEYEIRVKRSIAFRYDLLHVSKVTLTNPYLYNGSATTADFFNYVGTAGSYKVNVSQKDYRSDFAVECFQTISNDSPFDDNGLAMISVSVPSVQISSIYVEFTRYAPVWNGSIWYAEEVPTKNPAALYRQLLLGGANANPVPGECIDDEALAAWYDTCVAQGYEANAVMQGSRVSEAKQMLATCGYASPRDADLYGVVEDKDTSAEPIRYIIAPHNSRDEKTTQELPIIPDAIRAEFNDETLSYAVNHIIIYRDGKDASTAKLFETFPYPGFTSSAKVTARGTFDLKQAQLRQVRYARRVGWDGIVLERGMLVGLSCDIIDGDRAAGWITAITTDGSSNVVSVTLDSVMPWSASTDFESVTDISALTDITSPSEPMGIAIRIPGSSALLKQVSSVVDSNTCTFTTPFPLAGSGLAVGQLAAVGKWGNVVRRCKVMSVVPKGITERLVILADEAPGLFS